MIEIWQQQFLPTYTKNEGKIKVLNDADVPRPENFKPDSNCRSTVVFDPGNGPEIIITNRGMNCLWESGPGCNYWLKIRRPNRGKFIL